MSDKRRSDTWNMVMTGVISIIGPLAGFGISKSLLIRDAANTSFDNKARIVSLEKWKEEHQQVSVKYITMIEQLVDDSKENKLWRVRIEAKIDRELSMRERERSGETEAFLLKKTNG